RFSSFLSASSPITVRSVYAAPVAGTTITRRLRLTYPILIGVCQGEFIKEVRLDEVGKLV
ncbi:MAG: hypothetical protein NZ709_00730, partial [Candidatus Marinimicrobia bacterium]|nr:hypothetical protein [Candidatus Neomarinimicrobiota bacterium]